MQIALIQTILPSREKAHEIGEKLLKARLVACYYFFPINSAYWWENDTHDQSESMLVCKTLEPQYEAILKTLTDLHPYDVPYIGKEVQEVQQPYFRWVREVLEDKMEY